MFKHFGTLIVLLFFLISPLGVMAQTSPDERTFETDASLLVGMHIEAPSVTQAQSFIAGDNYIDSVRENTADPFINWQEVETADTSTRGFTFTTRTGLMNYAGYLVMGSSNTDIFVVVGINEDQQLVEQYLDDSMTDGQLADAPAGYSETTEKSTPVISVINNIR